MQGGKMSKRFKYYRQSQMIVDNMTGFHYQGNKEICDLLNDESDRADMNLEICDRIVMEKKILEQYNFDVLKIMKKYEIENLEKLDQILFQQKKW